MVTYASWVSLDALAAGGFETLMRALAEQPTDARAMTMVARERIEVRFMRTVWLG